MCLRCTDPTSASPRQAGPDPTLTKQSHAQGSAALHATAPLRGLFGLGDLAPGRQPPKSRHNVSEFMRLPNRALGPSLPSPLPQPGNPFPAPTPHQPHPCTGTPYPTPHPNKMECIPTQEDPRSRGAFTSLRGPLHRQGNRPGTSNRWLGRSRAGTGCLWGCGLRSQWAWRLTAQLPRGSEGQAQQPCSGLAFPGHVWLRAPGPLSSGARAAVEGPGGTSSSHSGSCPVPCPPAGPLSQARTLPGEGHVRRPAVPRPQASGQRPGPGASQGQRVLVRLKGCLSWSPS